MITTRNSNLQLETLEARDVPAASPKPVLMVIANQDFYYASSSMPTHQLDSRIGTGVLKSSDGGGTWTVQTDVASQLNSAFQQTLDPVGSNDTLSDAIPHALSDYAQWRTRFGTGI